MSKIFVQQGNAAVSVSDEMERLVNQLLDANPIIKRAIEDEIEQVYQDAYRQWPVRVIPPKSADRRKEQTIYAIQQSGKTRQSRQGHTLSIISRMVHAPVMNYYGLQYGKQGINSRTYSQTIYSGGLRSNGRL